MEEEEGRRLRTVRRRSRMGSSTEGGAPALGRKLRSGDRAGSPPEREMLTARPGEGGREGRGVVGGSDKRDGVVGGRSMLTRGGSASPSRQLPGPGDFYDAVGQLAGCQLRRRAFSQLCTACASCGSECVSERAACCELCCH